MTANWTHFKMTAIKAQESENFEEAESMWQSALKEAEKLGKTDPRYILSVDNLAHVCFTQKKYGKAEPLYRDALMLRMQKLPNDHVDIATCQNNLGTVQYYLKNYMDAEANLKKALTTREAKIGKPSKEMATSLYQMGMLYHAQKKYPQSEDFYKQALELKNKVHGKDSLELVHILRNYAHLLRKTGRESIAEQMEMFANSIEKKHG